MSSLDTKSILGLIASVLTVLSFLPYIRNTLRGATKPHAFSWLIWSILTAVAFAGQISAQAGPGAWVMGLTCFFFATVAFLALHFGEREITKLDWLCLIAAVLAIAAWIATDGPLLSVILISLIDAVGFVPTIRKSRIKPQQETLSLYSLNAVALVLSLFALEHHNLVTMLYPCTMITLNTFFVFTVYRCRQSARRDLTAQCLPQARL